MALGLNELGTSLNDAVLNSGSGTGNQDVAAQVYHTSSSWIAGNLMPKLIAIVVFVTIAFVFYGGFLYFTAYGDETKATTAKKTLLYAFIGLILSLTAFSIISYVQRSFMSENGETQIQQNLNAATK